MIIDVIEYVRVVRVEEVDSLFLSSNVSEPTVFDEESHIVYFVPREDTPVELYALLQVSAEL